MKLDTKDKADKWTGIIILSNPIPKKSISHSSIFISEWCYIMEELCYLVLKVKMRWLGGNKMHLCGNRQKVYL